MDGIDCVLVDFQSDDLKLISHLEQPWPLELKQRLHSIATPGENEIDLMGELDSEVADHFAYCTNQLLRQSGIGSDQILQSVPMGRQSAIAQTLNTPSPCR